MILRSIAALVCTLLVAPCVSAQSPAPPAAGIIHAVEFQGLRRVSPTTLRSHISSREGRPLDPAQVAADVRALDALGWFESIRTEAKTLPILLASAAAADTTLPRGAGIRLVFYLEERPFLAKVEFRGSRILPRERLDSLLAARQIRLKVAAPVNPTELFRARHAIEDALADAGYPQAVVHLRLAEVPRASARAIFQIHDGPRVHVTRVEFQGNQAFHDSALQRQLNRVAPGAFFAGARGKTIYTPQRLAEDLDHLARFYRNRGYADVRLGEPQVNSHAETQRRWLPWPRRVTRKTLHVSIPIEEGPRFDLAKVALESANPRLRGLLEPALAELKPGVPYSEKRLEDTQDRLEKLAARLERGNSAHRQAVDLVPQFDRETQEVRVVFRVREVEPHIVRRIEFTGHHRFTDRYYRRRIGISEQEPLDTQALERGLARLARAGYIRPATRDDIRVQLDDAAQAADVTIRVEEIGRQRISLVGGAGGLSNSLGLAYTVFDLLGGEELIATHLEGGPGNLSVLLGIAKDSLFGTRASLGLNVFHNVVKPRLPGTSGRERLFASRNSGLQLGSSVPLTLNNTLSAAYESSVDSTRTRIPTLPGVPARSAETRAARRAVALQFSREAARETVEANASVSGGWLGGDEGRIRASLEYAHAYADPLTSGRNTWAWRGLVAGVSSYNSHSLLLHQRLFAGDQLVRGFRPGELAPYVASASEAGGAQTQSTGANLVAAVNGEYRVPIGKAEGVAFFDAGTGWLLPRWLGPSGREVIDGTNGVLRASMGLEVHVPLPVVHQTLRVHWAVNPLRLVHTMLSEVAVFRAPDRLMAFGWGIGSLF